MCVHVHICICKYTVCVYIYIYTHRRPVRRRPAGAGRKLLGAQLKKEASRVRTTPYIIYIYIYISYIYIHIYIYIYTYGVGIDPVRLKSNTRLFFSGQGPTPERKLVIWNLGL